MSVATINISNDLEIIIRMKIDEDEVWLWYHHLENVKATGLAKGEYCDLYGLNKIRYGNFKYILNYCKDTSPERYKVMMAAAIEWEKLKGTMTMKEFCKPRRIKKDDLYVAMKHQEVKYIILKRIADKVDPPNLGQPAPMEIEEEVPVAAEMLSDDPIGHKDVIEKWREMRDKPGLSLSDFISQRKLAELPEPEPEPEVPNDEPEPEAEPSEEPVEAIEAVEAEEPEEVEAVEAPRRGRKPKSLEEYQQDVDQPKEPMKFFTIAPPVSQTIDDGIGRIGESNWSKSLAPNIHPEPEIQLKGNRIELTFTKTVRLSAAPDTPQAQLIDIITLLKDL